ncbi:ABC transporter ATP-binding protein [Actinoallomurus sp. CA-150999]|uniref:ABC transporter ATP-binding protein n=1 Tax=Actinoallomurus sp. CA-150999 TaxID=3239887 RepID=UPI003D8D3857
MRRSLFRRVSAVAELAWRAHPKATAGSAAAALLTGLVPLAATWSTKLVLDGLGHRAGPAALLPAALALALTGLFGAVLPPTVQYAQEQLQRAVRLLVQDRLFRAVNAHPGLSRFENPVFHDRVRVAQQAGQEAPQRLVRASLSVVQQVITLAGFVAMLAVLSPLMVVLVLLAAVPSVRVQLDLSRRRADMMWNVSAATRWQIFFAGLLTSPNAAKEIRLFGLGDHLRARMLREQRSVDAAGQALARRTLRSQGLLSLLGAVVSAGGLVWAVTSAASGRLSIGDVSVFIAGLIGVQGALGTIVGQAADVHNSLLMFGHYHDVAADTPDLPTSSAPHAMPALRQGIELRDVWFRYDESQPWVLRGVNLIIPQGRCVALVGVNGAGKSTLVKLLCRLYDPGRGSIHWDGVDLRDLRPAELRDRIGAVFQDYMSYDLTAAENIGLGDLAATTDEERPAGRELIEAAARQAGIHEKLAGLPLGYDTLLSRIFFARPADGDDPQPGLVLSGGQWQRLALARALMRADRDLLILDEPSSGLDAQAEYAVHQSLRQLRQGRTSLLISHRLGAVRDADEIVVIADGQIAERGSHAELIGLDGAYARLFALQAQGYEAEPLAAEASRQTTAPSTRPKRT